MGYIAGTIQNKTEVDKDFRREGGGFSSYQQLLTSLPGKHQLLDKRPKNLRKVFCPLVTFEMREIEIERLHVDPPPGSQSQRVLYPGSTNGRNGPRWFRSCRFQDVTSEQKLSQVFRSFVLQLVFMEKIWSPNTKFF